MSRLTDKSLAKMVLTVSYQTAHSRHIDQLFCPTVNMWRDYFARDQRETLLGLSEGQSAILIDKRTLIEHRPEMVHTVHRSCWQPPEIIGETPAPRLGRWYPQGYLRGLPGIFASSARPMRISRLTDTSLVADTNHPLAGMTLTVTAKLVEISASPAERGGRCADWLEEVVADGPGMNVVHPGLNPDFAEPEALAREDDTTDAHHYAEPRMVNHIDAQARNHLRTVTGRYLPPTMRILDLMSSIESHLPTGHETVGLGMNAVEMSANPALGEAIVHDLNADPTLPFADGEFEAVCCHLSIEYLVKPHRVIGEVARVLRPRGRFLISFSNRWFPRKVTRIWRQLHDFERVAYLTSLLGGQFTDLVSVSFRNWPRPDDDPHPLTVSDPLQVLVARKAG